MNDINAACAGSTSTLRHLPEIEERLGRQTIEERLGRLADLKSKGLITEEEYSRRRQQIIDEV